MLENGHRKGNLWGEGARTSWGHFDGGDDGQGGSVSGGHVTLQWLEDLEGCKRQRELVSHPNLP